MFFENLQSFSGILHFLIVFYKIREKSVQSFFDIIHGKTVKKHVKKTFFLLTFVQNHMN